MLSTAHRLSAICRPLAPRLQRAACGARHHLSIQTHAATAKGGDLVQVHYTGTLDNGDTFDSSRPRGTPLEFIVGAGKVIIGFDRAVTGLAVGESRKVRLDPADGYGARDDSLVLTFPAAQAPKGLATGARVQLSNGMTATCTKIDDKELTLDLNHELAGQHLTFDVELLALTPAERMARATFGAGCFWGPELAFQRVPGVVSTEVGYANFATPKAPSYEDVCSGSTGASEVVQVTYDSGAVTFDALCDVFWGVHDPTQLNRQGGDTGTQYRSGIYCHTPEQLEAAKASKARWEASSAKTAATEVVNLDTYAAAEPYHQQYLARGGRFGRAQNPSKGCSDPIRCYG